jgi:hypothetical protein
MSPAVLLLESMMKEDEDITIFPNDDVSRGKEYLELDQDEDILTRVQIIYESNPIITRINCSSIQKTLIELMDISDELKFTRQIIHFSRYSNKYLTDEISKFLTRINNTKEDRAILISRISEYILFNIHHNITKHVPIILPESSTEKISVEFDGSGFVFRSSVNVDRGKLHRLCNHILDSLIISFQLPNQYFRFQNSDITSIDVGQEGLIFYYFDKVGKPRPLVNSPHPFMIYMNELYLQRKTTEPNITVAAIISEFIIKFSELTDLKLFLAQHLAANNQTPNILPTTA